MRSDSAITSFSTTLCVTRVDRREVDLTRHHRPQGSRRVATQHRLWCLCHIRPVQGEEEEEDVGMGEAGLPWVFVCRFAAG
jgi:hypothetical protein